MNFFKKFNKLNFKDKRKKKKILSLAVTIFGIGLIITGTSAAYLMRQVEGNNNTLTAGTLILAMENESSGLSLNGTLPMSDTGGINQDTSYTFTLSNSGTLKMNYEIKLVDKCSTSTSITIDGTSIKPDVCIPNQYIKIGVKQGSQDYTIKSLASSDVILKGTLDPDEKSSVVLKIWLDQETPNDYNSIKDEVSKNIIYYGQLELNGKQIVNLDESGANVPALASNMIPVYYDGTNWRKADSLNKDLSNQWYNYTEKMWANAVTVSSDNRDTYLNSAAGTPIEMDDINTMWVWIPRFSATGDIANYNGGTLAAPGAFDITFVDKNTAAHDAFDFGGPISGFWISKFENSSDITCTPAAYSAVGEGCNLTTIRPKILPNATPWRGAMVSTFFYDIQKMTDKDNQYGFSKTIDVTLDTHMLKNSEWGAVAYVTQSIYGRCSSSTNCTEVGVNNKITYTTGYGAPAGSSSSVTNGTYATALGMDASTTGNIYGVYDMSGGLYEYVMGVYWDGNKYWSSGSTTENQNSGFNGCLNSSCSSTLETGVAYPSDNKYYNLYTTRTNYESAGLQHAMNETSGWYGDYAGFVSASSPWIIRGGYSNASSNAGVFLIAAFNGYAISNYGSRTSIIIN